MALCRKAGHIVTGDPEGADVAVLNTCGFIDDAKSEAIEEILDAAYLKEAGMEVGKIEVWCNIESYLGLINAYEIATADPRIVALALGAEDFTASMKSTRTKAGLEIFYARNAILTACRHAGIEAIDAVFSDINDIEGLKEDTQLTKNLGFDGKTCVHPRQIDIVNSFFTPSAKEIKYALRVLQAVEEGARLGKGAVTLDGGMIDKPMELRARTTLAQAEAAGVSIGGMLK